MGVALLTFVMTLTLVLGSYWAFVVRPEAQFSGRIRKRLQRQDEQPVGIASVVKGAAPADEARDIIGRLRSWHRRHAVAAAGRLIESAGMRTDPQWLIGGTALTLMIVIFALQTMNAGWRVALVAGALTPLVPYFYIRHLARKRLNAFEESFPDALSLMSRALRAGHALTSTLALVADEVAEPVRSEFRALYEQHNFGLPLNQVLRTFALRIPLMDVRFFATAVMTQRETGGNLAEVLDNLSEVMRDRFQARRQLRVLTAQGRTTGWFLGVIPLLVAAGMYMFNPTQMTAFIADPVGFKLLVLALILEIGGVLAVRKIVVMDF